MAIVLTAAVADAASRVSRPSADQALTATARPVLLDVLANDQGIAEPQLLVIRQAPAHGTAEIVGNRIRYTSAPGFTGRDQFTYFAKSGRNAGSARVVVDVGTPLVMAGRVTDAPIADATVQASVDGHTFTAQADADGNYALEIIALEGGMVTMGAQGTGDQAMANFLSVVGDFDRLEAEAGSDGTLTRDENNQVQVTNVSTAQAYLMQLANDGLPIQDDDTLVAMRESLDNTQLLEAAAAIKLAVDGGFALPEGTSDTLELISNPGAMSGFLAGVAEEDPDAYAEAVNAIVSDPDLTAPTGADDLVGTYTLVASLGRPGTVGTGLITGSRVTLDADGTGSFVQTAPNDDASATWTFDEATGQAIVTPNSPVQAMSFPIIDGVGQIRMISQTSQYRIGRLFDGNGRDTLSVTYTQQYWYPDNPEIPGGSQTYTNTETGIRDETGILPFDADEIEGTTRNLWLAGTPYADANFTGSELASFDADGSGIHGGAGFDWSIDALGRLRMEYANGNVATHSRLNDDGREAEGLASDWHGADGTRSASYSLSAIADGFAFTPLTALAQWRSGFFVSRVSYDPGNTDFFLVLDTAGIGWRVSYTETAAFPTPMGWTVAAGSMEATEYRNGSNQPVHDCQVGVDGCYIWNLRRWRPVAIDGDRVYVIEEMGWDQDGDGDIDLSNQRGNFYERAIAPPFSAVAPPIARSKPRATKPVRSMAAPAKRPSRAPASTLPARQVAADRL